jgi:hypothetical protein
MFFAGSRIFGENAPPRIVERNVLEARRCEHRAAEIDDDRLLGRQQAFRYERRRG